MPEVHIPAILRSQVDGLAVLNVAGNTVGEVLKELTECYPAVRSSLMNESDQVHSFINLFVDGKNIRDLEQTTTAIGQDQTLLIVPALAGG